ncbi:MAG: inositol 2-dehydrogenase [Hyphomicrobiales bacterium]|nr:inositol 2-dehydrogenase [Hyphomicrobiales bacterium]
MTNICIFGAGRIGQLHAANVAANPRSHLVSVVDINEEAATSLAGQYGARVETDADTALDRPDVDAVIIGAPTTLHVDLILASARRGKPVFCEKPIDLDIARVNDCLAEMQTLGVPFGVGFNRRFDPTHRKMKGAIDAGDIGDIEIIVITSRDPAPPPVDYVKSSGGYFRDSTIHDLDLARWLLSEPVVEVSAFGSNLVDPAIADAGDFDTAVTSLKSASGKLCQINNSRRAVYGFDQRVEVFGSKGMLQTSNQLESGLLRWSESGTGALDRLKLFFLERYEDSFRTELDEFLDAIEQGRQPSVSGEDGRQALILADAAQQSAETGRAIRVNDNRQEEAG